MGETKHFVLVHGFCHGGWCWYKLVTMLKSNGYKVTALNMAGCGINPKQLHEISSLSEYVQPLTDFMSALSNDEKVILVVHSYGGYFISLAMENFPEKISMGVFVTAYMSNFKDPPAALVQELFRRRGKDLMKMDNKFRFDKGMEKPATSTVFGPDYMAAEMYQNCSLEVKFAPNRSL